MQNSIEEKAKAYAIANGEEPGTMDYLSTVLDFSKGYTEGVADMIYQVKTLTEENKILKNASSDTIKEIETRYTSKIRKAIDLLRKTYLLPQNQRWNNLYREGESIREQINNFLTLNP